MKQLLIAAGLILAASGVAKAANANRPYSNVDHRNDAGNNTGDSQVEALNQSQLNGQSQLTGQPRLAPNGYYRSVPASTAERPPAAAYPPPAVYAAPPYYYYPAPAYVVTPRPFFYARPFYYPYW